MHDGQPSHSALTAAAARAAHLTVDGEPRIFADTLAATMLGDRSEELLSYHRLHGRHPVLSGARAQVVCRSRYTEDVLTSRISRGVTQYVILGAGLDSFPYRSGLASRVHVFEVDHPATQDWKRRALATAGIPVPRGVTFVPLDLGAGSLGEQLRHYGLDASAPALVAWLGVTMYLTPDVIVATLSDVGAIASGTELIADYLLPPRLRDEAGMVYAELVAAASAERGEPWLSAFAPDEIGSLMRASGFGQVRHVEQRDAIPASLWDRPDSLEPAQLSVLAHGTVTGD